MELSLKPQIFQIEITSICNLCCTICPYTIMRRKKQHMDLNLFKLVVNYIDSGEKVGLHLMGEPLLHPQVVEMVRYLCDCGIKSELATNCTRMSAGLAQDLIDAGLGTIWFSIDAANKTDYETIRVGASYEKAIRNAQTFIVVNEIYGSPVDVWVQKVGPATDKDDSEEFLKIWGEHGRVKFMDSWAGTMNLDKIILPPSERYPCEELWKRVAVLSNGDVVPCCRDWDGQYIYGNLLEQSLREIWYGDKIECLRSDVLEGKYTIEPCKSCKEWYIPMNREVVDINERRE